MSLHVLHGDDFILLCVALVFLRGFVALRETKNDYEHEHRSFVSFSEHEHDNEPPPRDFAFGSALRAGGLRFAREV